MSNRHDTDSTYDDDSAAYDDPHASVAADQSATGSAPIDGTAEIAGGEQAANGDVADWGFPQKKKRVTRELVGGVIAMLLLVGAVGAVASRSMKSGDDASAAKAVAEVPGSTLGAPGDPSDLNSADPFGPNGVEIDPANLPEGNGEPALGGDLTGGGPHMANLGDPSGPFGGEPAPGDIGFGQNEPGSFPDHSLAGNSGLSPGNAGPDPFSTGSTSAGELDSFNGNETATLLGGSEPEISEPMPHGLPGSNGLPHDSGHSDAFGGSGSSLAAQQPRIDPFTGRPIGETPSSTAGNLNSQPFGDQFTSTNDGPDSGVIEPGFDSSLGAGQPTDSSFGPAIEPGFGGDTNDGTLLGGGDQFADNGAMPVDPAFGPEASGRFDGGLDGNNSLLDPGLADPSLLDPGLADPGLVDPSLADPGLPGPDPGLGSPEPSLANSGSGVESPFGASPSTFEEPGRFETESSHSSSHSLDSPSPLAGHQPNSSFDHSLTPMPSSDPFGSSVSTPPSLATIQPDGGAARRQTALSQSYVIQDGDSLWTISRKFYQAGRYFHALGDYNRAAIGDLDHLKPGTEITIPDVSVLSSRMVAARSSAVSLTGQIQAIEPTGGVAANASSVTARRNPTDEATGLFYSEQGYPMYRVGKNDTLTSIAASHLGRVSRWQQVFHMNRDSLNSPDNLQIGMVLKLPADASSMPLVRNSQARR